MKKIIITIMALLFSTASYSIEKPTFSAGLSVAGGVFEADGASETNADATFNASEDDAEALYGIGSVFIEAKFNDKFVLGLDYVPHSLDTETTENVQRDLIGFGDNVTNTVQIDFEDYTTLYASIFLNENVYAKAGYVQVEAITNENLGTGGAYGNETFDGFTLGLGYNRDLDNGAFIRFEGNYTEFDGVTSTNTVDTTKSITVDGITGYGAKISVGKNF